MGWKDELLLATARTFGMSKTIETFRGVARALGPNRARAALSAFGDRAAICSWQNCVLARSYGAPGALHLDAEMEETSVYRLIHRRFGIRGDAMEAVIKAFDGWHRFRIEWRDHLLLAAILGPMLVAGGYPMRYYLLWHQLRKEALSGAPEFPATLNRYGLVMPEDVDAAIDEYEQATREQFLRICESVNPPVA